MLFIAKIFSIHFICFINNREWCWGQTWALLSLSQVLTSSVSSHEYNMPFPFCSLVCFLILFDKAYLNCGFREQQFCSLFSLQSIQNIFCVLELRSQLYSYIHETQLSWYHFIERPFHHLLIVYLSKRPHRWCLVLWLLLHLSPCQHHILSITKYKRSQRLTSSSKFHDFCSDI